MANGGVAAPAEDRGPRTEDGRSAGGEEDAVAAVDDRRSDDPTAPDGGHRPPLSEGSFDDGAPVGPADGEESAFLAEQREQGFSAPPASKRAAAADSDPDDKKSLPPLDDLVQRIPAETRQLMDELFRAHFVTVKRVPKSALKN